MRLPTSLAALAVVLGLSSALGAQQARHVLVDQFGYRPLADKVAVLREAVIGHDAPDAYTPGALLEVRRTSDSATVWSGAPVPWNGGAVHDASGDHVWWLDFSELTAPGSYVIVDPTTGETSHDFDIAADVYDDVLVSAVRMFFYQRCGGAKAAPFAATGWTDTACHIGPGQDLACLSVLNPVPSSARDLSGGWHDAGDFNKYVNFCDETLHRLMDAYELAPHRWRDNFGIPESGNGVADLLDEIRWEVEWLLKMQTADGSVLHKVSVQNFSAAAPPSGHATPRRYAPSTASATISACGVYARAARLFGDAGLTAFAAQLETAALEAWAWLEANPGAIPSSYDNAGFASVAAEDSAQVQGLNRTRAALQLFRLTGDTAFRSAFDAGQGNADLFAGWASPWNHEWQSMLLEYTVTPDATPSVVQSILAAWATQLGGPSHLGRVVGEADAYRAPLFNNDYTWGSNRTKSLQGAMYAATNRYGVDVPNASTYRAAAEGFLHDLHGVNPNGLCYLTNMASLGAERSANETYHGWFADGSAWDNAETSAFGPPPGFLTGGPNPFYSPDASFGGTLVPPMNQPIRKSYKDWNSDWPQNSWEVTECHIPYQSAYVRLLAEFAFNVPSALGLSVNTLTGGTPLNVAVGGASSSAPLAVLWSLDTGSYALEAATWTTDLGLALFPDPSANLLFPGFADASGNAAWSVTLPSGFAGTTLYLQATEGLTTPYAIQSGVIARTIQ